MKLPSSANTTIAAAQQEAQERAVRAAVQDAGNPRIIAMQQGMVGAGPASTPIQGGSYTEPGTGVTKQRWLLGVTHFDDDWWFGR